MTKKYTIIFAFVFFTFPFVNAQSLMEGSKAPDFKLFALDGSINTLETYKDKVIVIKMWFKECTPCLQEIPKVNTLVEKYQDRKDIVFIAPSPNNKSTMQKFSKAVDFKYVIMSSSYEMLKEYNVSRRYPTHTIIDKNGNISFFYAGTSENIAEILDTEIKKLL